MPRIGFLLLALAMTPPTGGCGNIDVAEAQCSSNQNCLGGRVCKVGMCVDCETTTDCAPGFTCEVGRCIADGAPDATSDVAPDTADDVPSDVPDVPDAAPDVDDDTSDVSLPDVPPDIAEDVPDDTADDADVAEDVLDDPICVPDCSGKECGDDGCGGSCGTCPANEPICIEFTCDDQEPNNFWDEGVWGVSVWGP